MKVKYKETQMKKIKDVAPKMSDAIQAMHDGLKSTILNPLLHVDMDTFGHKKGPVCFGCAATYTLMKLDGGAMAAIFGTLKDSHSRSTTFKFDREDFQEFERAIDRFRIGNYYSLYRFYEVSDNIIRELILPTIYLGKNWKKQLPDLLKIVEILKSHNL